MRNPRKNRRPNYKRPKLSAVEYGYIEGVAETNRRKAIKRQLVNKNGAICAICGEPIKNARDMSLDHIIPISKGGQTTMENCQLAHKWCNVRKGNKVIGSEPNTSSEAESEPQTPSHMSL